MHLVKAIIVGDGIMAATLAANLLGTRSVLVNPVDDSYLIGWFNAYRRWFIRWVYKDVGMIG